MLTILACGGLFSPRTKTGREFYLINVAKGTTAISANVIDGALSYPIATDTSFGEVSPLAKVDLNELDNAVRASGGGYSATSQYVRTVSPSVAVAMCPSTGPVIELYPALYLGVPTLVFFKDGDFDGASSLDVYVTAPGLDLNTIAKDGTLTENGKSLTLNGVLDINREFQVRLTRAGTKEVVHDFGVSTGLEAGKYRFYTLYHSVTAEQFKTFDFLSSTTGF
jgi:hypothetical protein